MVTAPAARELDEAVEPVSTGSGRTTAVPDKVKESFMTNSDSAMLSLLSDSGQTVSNDDEDIRHRTVKDNNGADIGHVADLLIDEREHKVRFLLVEHGGFIGIGRKETLIPVDDITAIDGSDVHIDHSKDHVASGPAYDPELMADSVYVGSVYDHYGSTPFWGVGYGLPTYPYYPANLGTR